MLYITTRNKTDSFTAYRALHEERAPDSGFFVPLRLPFFTEEQINALMAQPSGEIVARVLNLFFSSDLTGWDVDCCIGKKPVIADAVGRKTFFARGWNNPKGDFEYVSQKLYEKLTGVPGKTVTQWAGTAIRIAVLFALCSQLQRQQIAEFDMAVNAGDFALPMAVWYARKMGLPVQKLICVCNENSNAWDLLCRGEMDTGIAAVSTDTPDLDVSNPAALEQLIFNVLGYEEAKRYVDVVADMALYQVKPEHLEMLNQDIYVTVVGNDRIEPVMANVYRTSSYILEPYAAVSYGGLQDHRAKTGESRNTVILADRHPLKFSKVVQRATGLSAQELKNHF